MIKYYKELEEKKQQYLNLIEPMQSIDFNIEINTLPLKFYTINYKLFERLVNLDVLFNNLLPLEQDTEFLELLDSYGGDDIFYDLSNYEIEKHGSFKRKFDFLMSKFKYEKDTYEYYEYLNSYIKSIIKLILIKADLNVENKRKLKEYLISVKTVATLQGKLPSELEDEINLTLKELDNYDFVLPHRTKNIKFTLPDSWYITPSGELYNSMGEDGHKTSNLKYAYFAEINDEIGKNSDSNHYLDQLSRIATNMYITNSDFQECFNLIYNFASCYYGKSYDRKLVKLITGIYSAHACFFSFFEELKLKSANYVDDLKYIRQLDMDDLLVRICGFHKISSQYNKTITTSCVNYEEEFDEYIKNGWHIDFVSPIIISENRRKLEEYPEYSLTIRKILKK